jgi:large subunit ribosomal protein L20
MVRVRKAPASRKRRKRRLSSARGYRGARGSNYRLATEAVDRALAYSTKDRKRKKRDFRSLWIVRIGAAAREDGLSYSRLISGLKNAGIAVDRKILADFAVHHKAVFQELVREARAALE